jgi:transposase-like protein
MVRGNAKALAQENNRKKLESKKEAKNDATGALKKAALKQTCPVCKASMINRHQLVMHYESKHPKETVPPE